MRYVDEFRRQDLARSLARAIADEAGDGGDYRLMEFCGGHTHSIFRFALQDLMPPNVQFVHGPGCPVCVLPAGRVDSAMALVREHDVILCIYGDLLRVPGSGRDSLMKVRAAGGDVRLVYSTQDALAVARDNPGREVVFFAIGFETTAPATAVAVLEAQHAGLRNFSVYCNHVLTPPALATLLESAPRDGAAIDGFLGPSHVSTIIGSRPYEFVAERFHKPLVIAGFEPLDIMQSVLMLLRQLNTGRHEVENEYSRAVRREGNGKALALIDRVFEVREHFEWRGLGTLPHSGLALRAAFGHLDAERRFPMRAAPAREVRGCECPAVLRGTRRPTDCRLFATVCTPDDPMGACMVSSEGACAAWYRHGRFRDAAVSPPEPTR
jgi:hydrogenase expression/formation protein HypD